MNYDDVTDAVKDAEQTLRYADILTNKVARLLIGRLRKVGNDWVLRSLKTELRDYNMRTGSWKGDE